MDMGSLYAQGRKNFREYAANKERLRREDAATAHKYDVALAGMQYGEGSPAMLTAKTGQREAGLKGEELGLRREEFGFEKAYKPWQAAVEYDLARRGLQTQGVFHGSYPVYGKDPGTGEYVRTGSGVYAFGPNGQGGWQNILPQQGGGTSPPPGPYEAPPGPTYAPQGSQPQPIPQPMVPQYPQAGSIPLAPQPQGYGTMTVQGQPGYYGINMPGEGGESISNAHPTIKKYSGEPPNNAVDEYNLYKNKR